MFTFKLFDEDDEEYEFIPQSEIDKMNMIDETFEERAPEITRFIKQMR